MSNVKQREVMSNDVHYFSFNAKYGLEIWMFKKFVKCGIVIFFNFNEQDPIKRVFDNVR